MDIDKVSAGLKKDQNTKQEQVDGISKAQPSSYSFPVTDPECHPPFPTHGRTQLASRHDVTGPRTFHSILETKAGEAEDLQGKVFLLRLEGTWQGTEE